MVIMNNEFTASDYESISNDIKSKLGKWKLVIALLKYRQKKYMMQFPDQQLLPEKYIKILKIFRKSKHPYFISNTPNDKVIIGRIDDYDSFAWILNPNTNQHIIRLLKSKMKSESVFMDIGANIGLISLNLLSNDIQPKLIYAFEPSPDTYKRAASTLALNHINSIKLFSIALGDFNGQIPFNLPYGHSGGATALSKQDYNYLNQQGCNTIKVTCNTLDRFCDNHDIKHIDLMKIDVEGYELNVLNGAINVISRDAPTFLYEYNQCAKIAGWTYEDIEDIVTSTGRRYKYSVLHKNGEHTTYPPEEAVGVDILAECDE